MIVQNPTIRYGLITMLELKMLTMITKTKIVRKLLFLQCFINNPFGSGRNGEGTGPI